MKFEISENAKAKLAEYKEKSMPIKVKITGYSWCGAKIGIVSEKQLENENVYNGDGFDIIVSDDLDGFKGFSIDYINNFFNKSFEVTQIY